MGQENQETGQVRKKLFDVIPLTARQAIEARCNAYFGDDLNPEGRASFRERAAEALIRSWGEQVAEEITSRKRHDLPPPSMIFRYPILQPQFQVKSTIPPESDPHPPEHYVGDRGSNYPVLPPYLQTTPMPGDIHPPGYHMGGPGPYLPPNLRVPKGSFGG